MSQEQTPPAATGQTGPAAATGSTGTTQQPGSTGRLGIQIDQMQAKTKQAAETAKELAKQYVPPAVGAAVLLVVAWIVSGWGRRAARRGLDRVHFDPTLGKFASNMVRWVILTFAVVTCLRIFGIESTSFAVVLGTAGLAVGLALQGSLANLAAGVMLLIFRPFKVGDTVVAAGQTGKVNEIDLFQTTLDTADGRRVFVPNGPIFGSVIENTTYHPRRRVDVLFVASLDADVGKTRQVIQRAISRLPGTLREYEPAIAINSIPIAGVEWTVGVWTATSDYGAVRDALFTAIKEEFDAAGLGFKK